MKAIRVFAAIVVAVSLIGVLSGCVDKKPVDRTPVVLNTEAELYKSVLEAGKTNPGESPNRVNELLERNGVQEIQAYYKFAALPEGVHLSHIFLLGDMITYVYDFQGQPLTLTWYCDEYAYSLISATLADMNTTTIPGCLSRLVQTPAADGSIRTTYQVIWSQGEYWFLAVFPATIDTDTIKGTCKAIKVIVE